MTTESTMKKLNEDQLEQLKENYANLIIDGMDMDCLVQFAFDSIMNNMEMWDEQDLKEEVLDLYDEEIWTDLTEGTTINVTYGDEMKPAS